MEKVSVGFIDNEVATADIVQKPEIYELATLRCYIDINLLTINNLIYLIQQGVNVLNGDVMFKNERLCRGERIIELDCYINTFGIGLAQNQLNNSIRNVEHKIYKHCARNGISITISHDRETIIERVIKEHLE